MECDNEKALTDLVVRAFECLGEIILGRYRRLLTPKDPATVVVEPVVPEPVVKRSIIMRLKRLKNKSC